MDLAPHSLILCSPRLNPKQVMIPTKICRHKVESDHPLLMSSSRTCCAVSPPTTRVSNSDHPKDGRSSANYQPTIWSYDFLQSLKNDHADIIYKERVAKLEQELRFALHDENAEPVNLLELIDDIQRLGLGHRFEIDINRALEKFVSSDDYSVATKYSLHAAALRFGLLRQHGYVVSQDVFKAFKDHKGNFKECLYKDVKGILSLYEASRLAFEGEYVMDEAFLFTRCISWIYRVLVIWKKVIHALELPLHRRMVRLEARWYIEAYGKSAARKPNLLELAKLEFNMVQSTLQEDLKEMTSKLNFARDRLMECFFWSVGMVSEPQFRNWLKSFTKVASFVTIIDDVYDVYGTLDELELFTEAVERWDLFGVKDLPKCMELCFLALYNSVNEMAYETLRDHGENIIPYLSKAWADLCKAFLKEAEWARSKHVPTFQDYLETAWLSSSGHIFLVYAYFLQSPNITSEALDSLEQYHDILRCPSTIFRLCNDLVTSKEVGCSEATARQHISDLIDNYWMKMNKCRIEGSPFAKHLVETPTNLARISQCVYGDVHGCPDNLSKNQIQSLIVDPVSIN
ncbi:putative terpene synthase 12 [Gossypium australe]|uniref:Putative terpene synthase 12 n=1 Tax=Gossypium australe TaxID=47621 RepID=A0A5B6V3Q9_9ROSI|nr:putative terpene synthase 12 [Gossypium australe]